MERKVASGTATVEAEADGTFVLRVDGSLQSQVDLADPTHLGFEYVRRIGDVLDLVAPRKQPISVVHVGGAGLTLARYVAVTRPRSRQIVLEPDEELTEFVREALPLPKRAGIKVRGVTGREGMPGLYEDSTDVVIVDAFVREAVPANLVTAEFVAHCARILRPAGVLVFNLIDGTAGLGFVRRVAATLRDGLGDGVVLAERKVLRGKGFGNVVLVGSPQLLPELTPSGRRAQPPYEVLPLAELAGKAAALTDAEGFASPAAPAGTFGR
ncbi:spermidine synthase [Kribbella sp. CA-293567]|uniref:spermidine synthase n=1 Tax=Kribbella sp. CA-293567 TaxID=3002436 RepID=UPI0022DE385E|nr:fused MFS/spermidine synthase [Kribbella sp. CA-293567]WBQ04200.1 fused MFS/spermidine synthase [Kribbella sp. CA-293567]